MLMQCFDEKLFLGDKNKIKNIEVFEAYRYLVGAACFLEDYVCKPNRQGVAHDFRYYFKNNPEKFPYSFIINQKSLLFYIREPAKPTLSMLKRIENNFEVKKNANHLNETTVRILNLNQAKELVEIFFETI